jgi:hypothetical protein
MRHLNDGVLRRILDEPDSVADRDTDHARSCRRCRTRRERIFSDQMVAQRLLGGPQLLPDLDMAWSHVAAAPTPTGDSRLEHPAPRTWRLAGLSMSSGVAIGSGGLVVAGAAAAATLTTVFAPTQVAPLPVSQGDLQSFVSALGMNGPAQLVGEAAPTGTKQLPFGSVTWSVGSGPRTYPTLDQAEAASGLAIALPSTLPSGVSDTRSYAVYPSATATVTFTASAGADVAGSSLAFTIGPAVVVTYGSPLGQGLPGLGLVAMARPIATSTGATTSELESFLLAQPGIPPDLAREIRLLGNLQTTLPVPTPPGASESSVVVNNAPAVFLSEDGGLASGVIWEDQQGIVHAVAGPLDEGDVLGVARQIG